MTVRITGLEVKDVRFPTSTANDGSDAMNQNPDHSLAYAVINTTDPSLSGYGITFTIGEGTDIVTHAVLAYAPLLIGKTLEDPVTDMEVFWCDIVRYSPLRWLGPEKGVVHLATAAITNALWDAYAKIAKKPLWKLLVDFQPEDLVRLIDFHYLEDVITQDEALSMLRDRAHDKSTRESELQSLGYPSYTTSAGWIGYPDEKLRRIIREKCELGWQAFKIKVGRNLDDDIRRAAIVREVAGDTVDLMLDANQVWNVPEAIESMKHLAEFNPLWIEEPTSPDDILGHEFIARHIAPVGVATGEHCHNRVMFKQFFQRRAIDYCQLDACRLGGINEALAVLLLAAKFDVPVCPHAGALGLREVQQHLSIMDYVAVSASLKGRRLEYADSFNDAFVTPARVVNGHYQLPDVPGMGVELQPSAYETYEFPNGTYWNRKWVGKV